MPLGLGEGLNHGPVAASGGGGGSGTFTVTLTVNDGVDSFGVWSAGGNGMTTGDVFGASDFGAGGVSFTNVTVPAGATILTASLEVNVSALTGTPNNAVLFADPGSSPGNPLEPSATNRPKGHWWGRKSTNDETIDLGSTGTGVITLSNSADLVAMIQEVIDGANWASGNRINLGLYTTGAGWATTDAWRVTDLSESLALTWSTP